MVLTQLLERKKSGFFQMTEAEKKAEPKEISIYQIFGILNAIHRKGEKSATLRLIIPEELDAIRLLSQPVEPVDNATKSSSDS